MVVPRPAPSPVEGSVVGVQHTDTPVTPGSISVETVWKWLGDVPDPEIPVISVTDLGVVRAVAWHGDTLKITVTPTYSGCPATRVIEEMIRQAMANRGIVKTDIETRISPPWTTDWITAEGLDALERYGIASPRAAGGPEECPRCQSPDVERVSQFGSTPCKAQWRCNSCLEPFDYFKCI